jgi:NADP-dependent 3-hydroxy acid dehydrogenase YdfG
MALAEGGVDIAIVSKSPHQDIDKLITHLGRRFIHQAADLTKRDHTRNAITAVGEKIGDLEILVNNAGIIRSSLALDNKLSND